MNIKNKICTSIEQSQKLVELGIDANTADMIYNVFDESYVRHGIPIDKYHTPAWSLAALLEVLPLEVETHKQTDGHKIYHYVESYMKRMGKDVYISTERYENLVDACVEMILKLHEEKLL